MPVNGMKGRIRKVSIVRNGRASRRSSTARRRGPASARAAPEAPLRAMANDSEAEADRADDPDRCASGRPEQQPGRAGGQRPGKKALISGMETARNTGGPEPQAVEVLAQTAGGMRGEDRHREPQGSQDHDERPEPGARAHAPARAP